MGALDPPGKEPPAVLPLPSSSSSSSYDGIGRAVGSPSLCSLPSTVSGLDGDDVFADMLDAQGWKQRQTEARKEQQVPPMAFPSPHRMPPDPLGKIEERYGATQSWDLHHKNKSVSLCARSQHSRFPMALWQFTPRGRPPAQSGPP